VLHADETTGRAAGALAYVHVACTEYLTLMHVGGRASDDIDAGGVLPEFTGTLMRDGYAGYAHLPAVHAWCAQHYADIRIMPTRERSSLVGTGTHAAGIGIIRACVRRGGLSQIAISEDGDGDGSQGCRGPATQVYLVRSTSSAIRRPGLRCVPEHPPEHVRCP
jgi:transposase